MKDFSTTMYNYLDGLINDNRDLGVKALRRLCTTHKQTISAAADEILTGKSKTLWESISSNPPINNLSPAFMQVAHEVCITLAQKFITSQKARDTSPEVICIHAGSTSTN